MKIIEQLVQTPAAAATARALIHFLWQGALIAAALAAILYLLREKAPRWRYLAACMALLAMPLAFGLTLAVSLPEPASSSSRSLAGVFILPPLAPAPASSSLDGLPLSGRIRAQLPWLAPLWMAGVLLFYVRTAGGILAVRRIRRRGIFPASAEWQRRLQDLGSSIRLSRPVVLLESCLVETPVVIGILRPAILVPFGLLTGLPAGMVEAVLVHELAHIFRRDYVVNVLQKLVEGLLFFHPAVWWVSSVIRAERENCCDDVAVAWRGDARAYAAALATLERRRGLELAPAANGGDLTKRIRRLLRQPEPKQNLIAPLTAAGLMVFALGAALYGWQAKPRAASAAPQRAQVQSNQDRPPVAVRKQKRDAEAEAQSRTGEVRTLPDSPYVHWLAEDVAYIVTDAERKEFLALESNQGREQFIERFWIRRDPTPGTVENEFKAEHYRRIAFANERYSQAALPGWKTDRGRIYITFGPADEIEAHPSGGRYERPAAEGGGTIFTFAFERWRYRYIEGIGNDVVVEFTDPGGTGEYRMSLDPSEKEVGLSPVHIRGARAEDLGNRVLRLAVPLGEFGRHAINVAGRITDAQGATVTTFAEQLSSPPAEYIRLIPLPPGSYSLTLTLKDAVTGQIAWDSVPFDVK